ncbi:MAG: hypothetical protein ACPGN3_13990 [Opitutales bacterium]
MIHFLKAIIVTSGCIFVLLSDLKAQASISQTIRNQDFAMTAPIMQFVTVKPFEIRVEFMAECEDLLRVLDYSLQAPDTIQVSEQASLFEAAEQYFSETFSILLDSFPKTADLVSSNFLRIGDENSVVRTEVKDEPLDTAVLGVLMSFEHKELPDFFQMAWKGMPEGIPLIPCTLSQPDKEQELEFSEYVLSMDWGNDGVVFDLPKVQSILAETNWLGSPKLDESQVPLIIKKLIENVYGSFEYVHEDDVYEKLATSVGEQQLSVVFLEQRRIMEAANRGGPSVDILNIDVEPVESFRKEGKGFEMAAEWLVSGAVTHFGHTHQRQNFYRARLGLAPEDGFWKFSKIELLEERRLK